MLLLLRRRLLAIGCADRLADNVAGDDDFYTAILPPATAKRIPLRATIRPPAVSFMMWGSRSFRALQSVGSIDLRAFRRGYGDGVPDFLNFERHFASGTQVAFFDLRPVVVVAAAFERMIIRGGLLDGPLRAVGANILKDDGVARLHDSVVGLSGDDKAEGLQGSGGVEFAFIAIENEFTNVMGSALWRDGPHHVGEALGAGMRGGVELFEASVDNRAALFTDGFGLASGVRQERRPLEADVSGSARAIADGGDAARYDGYTVGGAVLMLIVAVLRAERGGSAENEKRKKDRYVVVCHRSHACPREI
jgi:hypothetical protein